MISNRTAEARDAEACAAIMRASIRELCRADHGGDAAIVDAWTANKTSANVLRWIGDPRLNVFLVERAGAPAGVGAVNERGEILLNYVAPAHRFTGVSRSLLAAMEGALKKAGVRTATLTSTETAHRFYQSAGWADAGPPEMKFGVGGYPMEKRL